MSSVLVAGGKFVLEGTDARNAILKPVFDRMTFPWARITALPRFPVPITWDDLNDGTLRQAHAHADHGDAVFPTVRHHSDGDEGHAIKRPGKIFGEPEARLMIAGVFWTDGRIKIDIRLESRPDSAREVLSAELAHAVDYGLPLNEVQKTQLMTLFHPHGPDEHTWWEVQDYGAEYYTLVGEGFMALFTHSYYPGVEPWQDPFVHKSTASMGTRVHQILGAPPTGGSTPTPPPVDDPKVKHLKGYRTFHKSGTGTHYETQWKSIVPQSRVVRIPRSEAVSKGLVPCKVCKP